LAAFPDGGPTSEAYDALSKAVSSESLEIFSDLH